MPALDPERVAWHLWNWERWMESATLPGQLKASSAERGYQTTAWDLDAEYEEMDRRAGETVQAAIDDLDQRLRVAILVEHGIMSKAYRLPDQAITYAQARSRLAMTLYRKGLV